jgi:hypothetical protein
MCFDQEKTQGVDAGQLRRAHRAMESELKSRLDQREGGADSCNESPARPMSEEEMLAEMFRYHAPTPISLPKFAAINQAAKNFAEIVLANCPRGADRVAAVNTIRMARMLANQAIATPGLQLYA